MRILLLSTHLNIGGVGRYVTSLAKSLKARKHEVFVASGGGQLEHILRREGIPHLSMDIKTKSELNPRVMKSFFTLRRYLKEQGIELMHAHTRVTQVVAALLSANTGIPYVTTCHGFFKRRIGRIFFGCWGKAVIAISEAVRERLVRDFSVAEEKIALIRTGIEIENFTRNVGEERRRRMREEWHLPKRPIIGTVGRLSDVKGQSVLLEAAKIVCRRIPVSVLIVGEGPEEKRLRDLANRLGLRENVFFVGAIEDVVLPLSLMDIFVLPSLEEGLGLSLAEAMATGRPVCVASRVGGVGSLMEDKVTGISVESRNPDELARSIIYLLENAQVAQELKVNAQRRVIEEFDIRTMVANVEAVYEKVLSSRILVFSVNWLGDAVFTSPFIRSIKKRYPGCHLTCIIPPRCKEVLQGNPHVDTVLLYDEKGAEKSLFGKLRFAFALRKGSFDVVFVLHRSFTKALIAFIAGIRERVGYDTKRRGLLLTRGIKEPSEDIHRVEYYLGLAGAVQADVSNRDYEFMVGEKDLRDASRIMADSGVRDGKAIVVLNPGGNWWPKRWPTDHFAKLADRFIDTYGVTVVITGSEKDRVLAGRIVEKMRNRAVSLCGKTSIGSLAAVFRKAQLVISGDSGPMHIAVAVGANVVALFGPTSPAITGPYGRGNYTVIRTKVNCPIPCYDKRCTKNRCMESISPDEVFETSRRYLSRKATENEFRQDLERSRGATPIRKGLCNFSEDRIGRHNETGEVGWPLKAAQKLDNLSIKRILLISLTNIGDVVLTTPVLRVLSERYPMARIDVIVGPNGVNIFESHPAVSGVICYDKHATLASKRNLIAELRKNKYDLAVDLRNSLFPYVVGARFRTNPLRIPPKNIYHKKRQHLWRLTTAGIGIDVQDAPFYLHITDADREYVAGLLRGIDRLKPVIAVSPGAKSDIKRWPAAYFSGLIGRLIEEYGAQIVTVGDKGDRKVVEEIKKGIKTAIFDVSGRTTLRQLAAVLETSDMLITNDSAPLHIAGGVGTKVLAIFGPTDPASYGPTGRFDKVIRRGLSCSPCGQARCRYAHECLEQLGVEEVLEAARKMIDAKAVRHVC